MSSSTTYTYDAMSNRLSKETTSGTTTYTYNELNQLITSSDATYTYDADGNQIAVQETARSVTYRYNDLGRMSSAVVQSLGQTTLETYTYNGNGIRIAKNTDGIETRYLIDPNGALSYVLAEYNADGNLSAYYTRGTELISRETSGEIRYYQYDPNGSVRLLTDASGDISDTYTYDAFGSLIFQTGTSGNSFLFQGEQYEAATGLYYLRARYMNPTTGTFTTMDAYQGSTSDPMSLHKYLFANANPVMNSDPSGYDTYTVEETSTAVTMMTALANAANGFSQTAIAVFNSLTATLFTAVVTVGAPIAMFVGNNPQFIDVCLRIANGEIRLDALRDYFQNLYNDLNDKVGDLVDRGSDTARNVGNSSSNSAGNPPPPVDPNNLDRIRQIIEEKGIQFSDKFKLPGYQNQVSDRGWTEQMIRDAIDNPYQTSSAINKITGNVSTRFYIDNQYYVVVDNITGKIIQVADLTDPFWQ